MKNTYERRIGKRTIYGTDWPVDLIVTKAGRKWELSERCNGTCKHIGFFPTKAEAIGEAEIRHTFVERHTDM